VVPAGHPRLTGPSPARPLLAAERINASGSLRVRRLIESRDYDGIVRVAREQLAAGADALDVCAALPDDEEEAERMLALLARLRRAVPAPIFVDSIDPAVQLAALRLLGSRAIVNSVNLRAGLIDFAGVLGAARELGAGVVVQTIDERGLARDAETKLRIAVRAARMLMERFGLAPEAIIVDPLLFPVASAPGEARETLTAVQRIKAALPGVRTLIGLSNASYGLAPRRRVSVERVLLDHTAAAGLDIAIANIGRLHGSALPAADRAAAEALIFGTRL
jgi:5-methyltetrahydrofolate--homocysteine methyltransferase